MSNRTLAFDQISFWLYLGFKWNKHYFHYIATPMMTSQILKSVDLNKMQKSRYLENETMFFLQKKNHYLRIKSYFMAKNRFVAEVTFKKIGKTSYLLARVTVVACCDVQGTFVFLYVADYKMNLGKLSQLRGWHLSNDQKLRFISCYSSWFVNSR